MMVGWWVELLKKTHKNFSTLILRQTNAPNSILNKIL